MKAAFVVIGIAALGLLAELPVRADVEIVQKTVINCPGIMQMVQGIPEGQRGSLLKMMSPMLTGEPSITTTYLKGARLRTDIGQTTTVVNAASGNSFTLNRQTKAYSIGPYNPFQKAAGNMTCRIIPIHKTSIMLGHPVNSYSLRMTSSVLPQAVITGELWAAPDLPSPPSPQFADGTAAAFQAEMANVKGMPLAYKLVYRNTPAGDITVDSYATSIKEEALSAAVFTIPADFHKGETRMATGSPDAGFPLGDGMPLDTLSKAANSKVTRGSALPGAESSAATPGVGADISKMLSGMSPDQLQKLLSGLSGGGQSSGGIGNALAGMSPADLSKLLSGFSGGGLDALSGSLPGGGDGASGMGMQQLGSQLQGLMQNEGQ